jgi:hypothetical protein
MLERKYYSGIFNCSGLKETVPPSKAYFISYFSHFLKDALSTWALFSGVISRCG